MCRHKLLRWLFECTPEDIPTQRVESHGLMLCSPITDTEAPNYVGLTQDIDLARGADHFGVGGWTTAPYASDEEVDDISDEEEEEFDEDDFDDDFDADFEDDLEEDLEELEGHDLDEDEEDIDLEEGDEADEIIEDDDFE